MASPRIPTWGAVGLNEGALSQAIVFIEPLESRLLFSIAPVIAFQPPTYLGQSATSGAYFYTEVTPEPDYLLPISDESNLWRSDGSPQGTFLVPDDSGKPLKFTDTLTFASLPGKLLVAGESRGYRDFWAIPDATGIATNLRRGDMKLFPDQPWAVLDGVLYFAAGTKTDGTELWRSDGTLKGTYLLKDIQPQLGSNNASSPDHLTIVGGNLFFTAYNSELGTDLYVTDGTADGTRPVADLGAFVQYPAVVTSMHAVGNKLLLVLKDRITNEQSLAVTDGTNNGTRAVSVPADEFRPITAAEGQTFFVRRVDIQDELWRTDGTAKGTYKIFEADRGGRIFELNAWKNTVYFPLSDAKNETMLMVSDGTSEGTVPGVPPFDLVGDRYVGRPIPYGNGTFVFTGRSTPEASDRSVFLTDGTAAGTKKILDGDYFIAGIIKDRLYLTTWGLNTPATLWAYQPNTGGIAGNVFNDANANGLRDAGEKALVGYKVFIDRNGDGVCNKNETFTRASSTGRYRFDLLQPGAYRIRVVGVEGKRASTSESYRVNVAADQTTTRYFGRTDKILIAGLVYMDANKNGTIDNGESGMSGWTAFIDGDRDGVLDSTELTATTDELGRYIFSTLDAGSWQVRVVGQSKYRLTAPGAGYRSVTLGPAQISSKSNFGEKRLR